MNATTPPTPPTIAFTGWFRPNKAVPWTRIVEAGDYHDAWGLLLDATKTMRGGESLVLRAGVDPNRPAPKYRHGGRRLL